MCFATVLTLFSFGIMRKEEKEMTETAIMALVIFLVWFIFGWAYLSECDRLEDEETDEE